MPNLALNLEHRESVLLNPHSCAISLRFLPVFCLIRSAAMIIRSSSGLSCVSVPFVSLLPRRSRVSSSCFSMILLIVLTIVLLRLSSLRLYITMAAKRRAITSRIRANTFMALFCLESCWFLLAISRSFSCISYILACLTPSSSLCRMDSES